MSEENSKSEIVRDASDPLGFLIIPLFGVILVAVLLLWFNQNRDEEEQAFFPVSGMITMNNEPLVGRYQINFYPSDDSYTPIASAIIQDDGSYELSSGNKGIKGAMPGEYRVSVVMLEELDESFRMQDPKQVKLNPKDGGTMAPPDPDPPFDKTFSDPKKTPQRAIIGKTDNRIDIDLPPPSKVSPKKKKGKQASEPKDGKKASGNEAKENVGQAKNDASSLNSPSKPASDDKQ